MAHGHRTAELRSIEFHRLVAERLDEELLEKTRVRVEAWLIDDGPVAGPYARRWRELLQQPSARIAERLVADTEEMRDLRQNTPFAGAVSPTERWKILREVR